MVAKKSKNKKSKKNNFKTILFFIISFSIFCFLFFSNIRIAQKRLDLIDRFESLKEKVNFLEQQKAMLESRISDAQTDDYWEGVMREQGYVKEGEESVVILSEKEKETAKKKDDNIIRELINKIKKLFIFRE